MVLNVEPFKAWDQVMYRPRCEISRKFAVLVGKKNLMPMDIRVIKDLGYRIEHVVMEVTE
jgi:hypothetical protein